MNQFQRELQKVEEYLRSYKSINISFSEISHQLKLLFEGVQIPKLIKPCTIGDGISKINENDQSELLKEFVSASLKSRIMKFVPASGAATRMFHKLHSVLNRFPDFTLDQLKDNLKTDEECKDVYEFLINLKKFAFYYDLKQLLKKDDNEIEKLITKSPVDLLNAILLDNGLNYLSKPKGAIKFHRYDDECRTAFEEQIYESLKYAGDKNNNVKIHFTISEEHTELFEQIIKQLKVKLSNTDFKIDVTYSYQKKSTDTIALNVNNEILFNTNGNLIHRPSGHGALLENLNELNGDIVVIKNIDNLSVERLSADTILYKKLLIGLLVKTQKQIFNYLESLEKNNLTNFDYEQIMLFAEQNLCIPKPVDFTDWNNKNKSKFLFDRLNRPLRVCGMVKNEGEPGGGPFWVESIDGSLSIQIVEQAQIRKNDEDQKSIFNQSTHFNPVDLICGVKDYKGNNFNLKNFVDYESGIITKKSRDGIELKALELPGLWNGSMAYWNTIFVEVPISTFNPVKEVNNLLKAAHQGY
ncbi:MAG: DUF4301 family protein [Ignavibacteriaceae bacterium]